MTGAGTLPSGEEPDGSIGYGSLEDFSLLSGGDFIIQLVNQITFAATGYTNLQDALEKIASQIGFPELAQLLLEAFEGITGSVLNFLPWFINLTDLLGFDLNIDPADFNPISVLTGLVERVLELLGLDNILDMLGLGGVGGIFDGLFGLFGGASDIGGATNFLDDILGLLGTPTDVGSGNPVVDLIGRIPIFGGLLDQLFGGLTGSSTSGATQAVVGAATTSTTDTLSGQGALIEQIKAALGGGTPDADDFERASLGSAWTFVSSSGTGTIPDSHNFHYSGNTTAAEYVMRKNDIVSATDHITSTIVLNQAIPVYFFLPLPYGGNIDVWVRQTSFTTYATRTGVRLRINSNGATASWSLDWVNSGTATNLDSGSCSIPSSSAPISLEAGAGGNTRRFLGTINGSPICDFTDAGLVTTVGASNRYRGFGGRGTNGIGTNQGTPDIRQWTAQG